MITKDQTMNNRTACGYWYGRLIKNWAATEEKRQRLEQLSHLKDPTDEQVDQLVEWAAKVSEALVGEDD
jgi:hypothetical protein